MATKNNLLIDSLNDTLTILCEISKNFLDKTSFISQECKDINKKIIEITNLIEVIASDSHPKI
jgi:hypothetical protein